MEIIAAIVSAVIGGIFTVIAALISRGGKSRKRKKWSRARYIFTFLAFVAIVYLIVKSWNLIKLILLFLFAWLLSL